MPRRVRDPVPWCTVPDASGEEWTICFATPDADPELYGKAGLCVCETRMLYINVCERPDDYEATAIHEMNHAAIRGSANVSPVAHDTEEKVVSKAEFSLLAMAKRLGLRFPPRPEGYKALRRKGLRMLEREAAADE